MDDNACRFTLKFGGEVAADQHPAVVRKRLAAAMKLDEKRAGLLFSGKTVVVKRGADEALAEKFRETFASAGAVLVVEPENAAVQDQEAQRSDLQALPAGSDLVRPDEVRKGPPVEVSTDHISLSSVFDTAEPAEAPPVPVPETSHLTLAETGADMGERPRDLGPAVTVDPEFTVAEVGETLVEAGAAVVAEVDVPELDVAEPGARMAPESEAIEDQAPDTSKLELAT